MDEAERLSIIWGTVLVMCVLLVVLMVVWLNWSRYTDLDQLNRERRVEVIRACAHAIDVTSCLRDTTG